MYNELLGSTRRYQFHLLGSQHHLWHQLWDVQRHYLCSSRLSPGYLCPFEFFGNRIFYGKIFYWGSVGFFTVRVLDLLHSNFGQSMSQAIWWRKPPKNGQWMDSTPCQLGSSSHFWGWKSSTCLKPPSQFLIHPCSLLIGQTINIPIVRIPLISIDINRIYPLFNIH